jgi:signal transduction histidine kinase
MGTGSVASPWTSRAQWRAALGSGLASLLVFTAGALWLRRVLFDAHRVTTPIDDIIREQLRPVDLALATGVPLAALFVSVVAWVVADRTLRPVRRMQRELADITAHSLDRRVPVPAGADQIAELARTTNATLDRLETSVRRQRRFVADASHELRTPIANLRAGLELALNRPQRTDWPELTRETLSDVDRLQSLATDLLVLARLDATTPVRTELVDLAALVLEQGSGDVVCSVTGPAPVRGNPDDLARLLRNLLDNARRHATSGVTVTVETGESEATLAVLDDGPGVPEGDRELIFDRFTRLDHARTRTDGGAGLGLAIAREIATAHGGRLTCEPATSGARFVLVLPLADQPLA